MSPFDRFDRALQEFNRKHPVACGVLALVAIMFALLATHWPSYLMLLGAV